jgi:hypothetical protein
VLDAIKKIKKSKASCHLPPQSKIDPLPDFLGIVPQASHSDICYPSAISAIPFNLKSDLLLMARRNPETILIKIPYNPSQMIQPNPSSYPVTVNFIDA